MSDELVARAIASMGVEVVEVVSRLVGRAGWSAGVVPFARVRLRESAVDLVLPALADDAGRDQSRGFRLALVEHPELRVRLLDAATRLALALDHARVGWRWGAVRVRRLPDGGSRAGIDLGADVPPLNPLALLDRPTFAPPTPDVLHSTRSVAPPPPARPSVVPPSRPVAWSPELQSLNPNERVFDMGESAAESSGESIGLATSFGGAATTSALDQPELRQTMTRAHAVIGAKQDAFVRSLVGSTGAHLVPRERAVEFHVAGKRVRFGCDQIASYDAQSRSWTWGWSTERFPAIVRAQSRKLRETGTNWRLDALALPELFMPADLAFRLGVTAAWIMGADACHFVRGDPAGEVVIAVYGVK